MGNLRDQIFYRTINDSLDKLRNEMCLKYKPKKENRFFVGGITYEIGAAKLFGGGVQFEISSKIPQEILPQKGMNVKYFKEVRTIMMGGSKKPADVKMDNIISSTNIQEIKERDYVKCTYFFTDPELWTDKDIDDIVRAVNSGKMELPEIHGITTLPGRAVIYRMQESMYGYAAKLIADFLKANEKVHKKYAALTKEMAAHPSAPVRKPALKKARGKKAKAAGKPKAKKSAPKSAKKKKR